MQSIYDHQLQFVSSSVIPQCLELASMYHPSLKLANIQNISLVQNNFCRCPGKFAGGN